MLLSLVLDMLVDMALYTIQALQLVMLQRVLQLALL